MSLELRSSWGGPFNALTASAGLPSAQELVPLTQVLIPSSLARAFLLPGVDHGFLTSLTLPRPLDLDHRGGQPSSSALQPAKQGTSNSASEHALRFQEMSSGQQMGGHPQLSQGQSLQPYSSDKGVNISIANLNSAQAVQGYSNGQSLPQMGFQNPMLAQAQAFFQQLQPGPSSVGYANQIPGFPPTYNMPYPPGYQMPSYNTGFRPDGLPFTYYQDGMPVDYASYQAAAYRQNNAQHTAAGAAPSTTDTTDEEEEAGARAVKRPRLVWTPQLHKRFEEAVQKLGDHKAVPKSIMQEMNVEGLTRENVASHLQKYRLQRRAGPATSNSEGKGSEGKRSHPSHGDRQHDRHHGHHGAATEADSQRSGSLQEEDTAPSGD